MYEEKDWIMRQIKQVAEGLGAMLSKESIKEILNFEQTDTQKISDEDIEKIIILVDVNQKKKALNLDDDTFFKRIKINKDEWNEINLKNIIPNDAQYQLIKDFINN